jgi:hypothetical protein
MCLKTKFISALPAGCINIGMADFILKKATPNSNGSFTHSTLTPLK